MWEWNSCCQQAIEKEKREAETRYGIGFGQTEVYCVRCGKPWGLGKHTCQDIRLQKLQEAKKVRPPIPRPSSQCKRFLHRVEGFVVGSKVVLEGCNGD
jgi:hypothetical protein